MPGFFYQRIFTCLLGTCIIATSRLVFLHKVQKRAIDSEMEKQACYGIQSTAFQVGLFITVKIIRAAIVMLVLFNLLEQKHSSKRPPCQKIPSNHAIQEEDQSFDRSIILGKLV